MDAFLLFKIPLAFIFVRSFDGRGRRPSENRHGLRTGRHASVAFLLAGADVLAVALAVAALVALLREHG